MILLTIITTLYFLLLIWFAMGLLLKDKSDVEGKTVWNPKVSILIAVRNEENTIGKLLEQLYQLMKYLLAFLESNYIFY